MDNDIKQMLEVILNRFDKVDERFDRVDNRLDKMDGRLDMMDDRLDKMDNHLKGLENELHDFRLEMKEEIRGINTKIDLIYNKLNSDMEQIKNKPEPKFKIVREQ
ncbi:MAG: hypothetical protein GX209_05655 [Epulopiscium sp.]|nr:hypothetical protein [Candidatus Epulonipiscium sp.]